MLDKLHDCDICGDINLKVMIDGATKSGRWGCMCTVCHSNIGTGLGIGRGQKYEWNESQLRYIKVDG